MRSTTTVNRYRFTEEDRRRAGLRSGEVRRRKAAEAAWQRFVVLLAVAREIDRQANRTAARYDRLAGA